MSAACVLQFNGQRTNTICEKNKLGIILFFQLLNYFFFWLCFSPLKYLLWEKYRNYPLTTTQGDRLASCENIVSRTQTSSLPPREARNTCERKQAKRRACLPRERLVQGEKHAGKEALLGVLDPTFTVSKTLQQWNTIPKSAGTKKLKAMNMLKQRPRP